MVIALIAQWAADNEKRKDGVTPDDANILKDESDALNSCLPSMDQLVETLLQIEAQEHIATAQASALDLMVIGTLINTLNALEEQLGAIRNVLATHTYHSAKCKVGPGWPASKVVGTHEGSTQCHARGTCWD